MAYRNDIFTPGTPDNPAPQYYQFPNENFNQKHGLNPGDVVGIKAGYYNSIDLGLGITDGITFINEGGLVELGWFGLGGGAKNCKFLGNGASGLASGFKLFDKSHFGLSWTAVGDLEAGFFTVDGAMMGMQLATVDGVAYPVNYQKIHVHDVLVKNTSDEAFYMGHVKTSPIRMDLKMERCKVLNSGRDAFQLRNCNYFELTDCEGDLIGVGGNSDHSHGLIIGGNSNGGKFKNVKITRCAGAGIFNIGFGDFVGDCCTFKGRYGVLIKTEFGDELKLGRQITTLNNCDVEGEINAYDQNLAINAELNINGSRLTNAPVNGFGRIIYKPLNSGANVVPDCAAVTPPKPPDPVPTKVVDENFYRVVNGKRKYYRTYTDKTFITSNTKIQ